MKKVVLALIVSMLAVPALAGVTVDCTIDGNEVTVTYEMVGGDANLPRAFGLDIIADANISIDQTLPSDDINDSDFYIYPGTIDVNDDGTVDAYGTPVAILDANTMIIEMGSLYSRPPQNDPDHNTPPPSSGWVIKFRVAKASNIHVDIKENVDRGGVVMEDVNYVGDVVCGDCVSDIVEDYTISGTVTYDVVSTSTFLSGVTMNGLPSVPVTDGNGDYDDSAVPSGWSGTVTPSKTGYGFKPTSRVYSNVTADDPDEDYCAYPGCWDWPGQCQGDTVGNDLVIDLSDFLAFKAAFGADKVDANYNPCADYDRNGTIDLGDFLTFKAAFGAGSVAGGCTPGDLNSVYCP